LIARGYRRIAFIKPYETYWVDGRIAGAVQAVSDSRTPVGDLVVFPPGPWPTGASSAYGDMGYHAMRRALQSAIDPADPAGPWGVIAPNDFTAFGLLRAIEDAGLRPGFDIGLVGFDDDPNSATVGLTTVRRPFETLGRAAAEMLLRELRGDRSSLEVRLRSQLIPRSSTRLMPVGAPAFSQFLSKEVIVS
ncbi:MAG TPA: substrate-binding domain-containing protein, partial [Planctomycetaceae bacterium]|nr:substrate-binding domain-containing protein [Planctomycetaceae bacterium]